MTESNTDVPPQERVDSLSSFKNANENRDYDVYTELMDAALEAKKRSMFPHFGDIQDGDVIVDAGSGTGIMAEAAAQDFRAARVYALDISHELMERAAEEQALTHIVFGDAAEQNFPDNSVDVKYFSTVGHEIESFGGEGRMKDAVSATYKELKPGGRIVIRDFAKPEITGPIYMQILSKVGTDNIEEATTGGVLDYNLLSTKALFLRFHQEFRGGNAFGFEMVDIDGTEYIKLDPEWAHEFYLRKDYTGNWRQEINEKYTYWTPSQARETLEASGYDDVEVIPDPNEYILENRLRGKIALFKKNGDAELSQIDFPPTHMVVVGIKPKDNLVEKEPTGGIDYDALKKTIKYDEGSRILTVDGHEFRVHPEKQIPTGTKKNVYFLEGEPGKVLKVVRKDGLNDHNMFKAMYQSIVREHLLISHHIPHMKILEIDPSGPPYRYFIQERVAEDSVSAADLIRQGKLSEEDIKQMAEYISAFELEKKWQLDTNPFNWYRVTNDDGTAQMTYIDGKVYKYDDDWEFRKIGLLQWIDPSYVEGGNTHTARIPKKTKYNQLKEDWANDNSEQVLWWKKYLSQLLQPNPKIN